jgi:hypothetical protein
VSGGSDSWLGGFGGWVAGVGSGMFTTTTHSSSATILTRFGCVCGLTCLSRSWCASALGRGSAAGWEFYICANMNRCGSVRRLLRRGIVGAVDNWCFFFFIFFFFHFFFVAIHI